MWSLQGTPRFGSRFVPSETHNLCLAVTFLSGISQWQLFFCLPLYEPCYILQVAEVLDTLAHKRSKPWLTARNQYTEAIQEACYNSRRHKPDHQSYIFTVSYTGDPAPRHAFWHARKMVGMVYGRKDLEVNFSSLEGYMRPCITDNSVGFLSLVLCL